MMLIFPIPLNPFFFFSPEKYGDEGVEREREREGGHNETRFRCLNAADIFLFSEGANELLPLSLSPSLPREPILPIEDKWPEGERATGIGNTKTSADSFHKAFYVEITKWVMVSVTNLLLQAFIVTPFYVQRCSGSVPLSLAPNALNGLLHKKRGPLSRWSRSTDCYKAAGE